jgi:carbamoyl-phosphate synthase small subunit
MQATLLLADGTYWLGEVIGATATRTGELCFNTAMTGYQETFSDPSYCGQIIVTTNSHIGNYGIHQQEAESNKAQIAGLVCRVFSQTYSRFDATAGLDQWLVENHVPGICGIDVRRLVRYLRNKGSINAIISTENYSIEALKLQLSDCPPMIGLDLAVTASTKKIYTLGSDQANFHIAVLDFGIKNNILQSLLRRNCRLTVFPANTPFSVINSSMPDGLLLSNGPGDPAVLNYAINTVKDWLSTKKPLMGICLGHQLLALAIGAGTYKMVYGHRGINHPVMNLKTGKAEITSQNHGFAVSSDTLPKNSDVIITHINLNDKSVEGIELSERNAFAVQYHPEANPGTHDSSYLFDQFINLLSTYSMH